MENWKQTQTQHKHTLVQKGNSVDFEILYKNIEENQNNYCFYIHGHLDIDLRDCVANAFFLKL